MSQPTIAIVGSGPIGSAYARVLIEQHPRARVVMFEAGPQLTEIPGESVRNIQDPQAKAQAREKSQGPQAGSYRASLGIPEATVTEGMFTARQGTHLLDFGGPGAAHAPSFPAAAAATRPSTPMRRTRDRPDRRRRAGRGARTGVDTPPSSRARARRARRT